MWTRFQGCPKDFKKKKAPASGILEPPQSARGGRAFVCRGWGSMQPSPPKKVQLTGPQGPGGDPDPNSGKK